MLSYHRSLEGQAGNCFVLCCACVPMWGEILVEIWVLGLSLFPFCTGRFSFFPSALQGPIQLELALSVLYHDILYYMILNTKTSVWYCWILLYDIRSSDKDWRKGWAVGRAVLALIVAVCTLCLQLQSVLIQILFLCRCLLFQSSSLASNISSLSTCAVACMPACMPACSKHRVNAVWNLAIKRLHMYGLIFFEIILMILMYEE